MSRPPNRHVDIRYREVADDEMGFEAKCPLCEQWSPLTLEFWYPRSGMSRCKACWRAYKAAKERGRTGDDAVAEGKREANRVRYWLNRERSLAQSRLWREANKERVAAYNKAYKEANRERLRAASKAYYDEAREVILIKKRHAYRERAA